MSIYKRGNSYYSSLRFPWSSSGGVGRVSRELQRPLRSLGSLIHKLLFSSFRLTFSHPVPLLYSLSIICILCIQTMLHRPCGACFLLADTEEAITARRGQIGWGSYLGRIMFDILHHYQLPPSPPQESYLSLADVPLSVMNFLCPYTPTSGPPHLSTSRLLHGGYGRRWGEKGEEIKEEKKKGM